MLLAYSSGAPSTSHQHLLQVPTGPTLLVASNDVVDHPPLGPDGGASPYAAVSNHHNGPVEPILTVHALNSLPSLLGQPASVHQAHAQLES